MFLPRPVALLALTLSALPACTNAVTEPPPAECGGKCDSDSEDSGLEMCVGVRGNGPRITSHLAAMARIIEHYGLVDAVAGGSSGSITSFLLESIQANPAVYDCGVSRCHEEESAARAALLFKSMQGYFGVLAHTDEAIALASLAQVAGEIREDGIEHLLETDPERGVEALRSLLESEDLRDLINSEVLELLATSPDPVYHARDILAALQNALSFRADDPRIFVRPGVLDFPAFVDKVGRVGSFYAGYGPADDDAMAEFLAACASPGRGLNWSSVARLPAGSSSCGELFSALLESYRARLLADEASYVSRVDDYVGAYMPALVTTSVLEGDAVRAFETARAQYLRAEPIDLDVDFDDVVFGYWGRAGDLFRVGANPNGYADLKTRKFRSLGEATWREVLAYSPAEPGLARALELPNGSVSAGGWSDLQPVLVLENLGCEKVVYLTRRGGAGGFLTGVAGMLGMTAEDGRALFDLASTDSAYWRSLAEAEGVWCTDWDRPEVLDIEALSDDGYNAPLETRDAFFLEIDRPYPNAVDRLGVPGCTLGVN